MFFTITFFFIITTRLANKFSTAGEKFQNLDKNHLLKINDSVIYNSHGSARKYDFYETNKEISAVKMKVINKIN